MKTKSLRRQHDGALAIVAEIQEASRNFAACPGRDAARAITIALARLTGLLRIHFAQEDGMLYPMLMASGQGGVAAVACRFFEEMGQIGPAYAAFADRWSSADAILADAAGFRRESDMIFPALGERIERENTELYPLADALPTEAARPSAA